MLLYLIKCFVALLLLWVAQILDFIPWHGVGSLVTIVVVPIGLVALTAIRWERRRAASEQASADAALSAVERHLSRRS
jgi:MFS superfamily sulfate permease-like transporter